MKHKRQPKHIQAPRSWEEWTLLGVVAVSTLMVVIALTTQLIKTPSERAEQTLKRLADDYYVEYLYPRLLGGNLNVEPSTVLAEYRDNGVATTYLRQLLHYNNDEHIGVAPVFQTVDCDTNVTNVRYFPTEPYGPKDYTVKYTFRCGAEELAN